MTPSNILLWCISVYPFWKRYLEWLTLEKKILMASHELQMLVNVTDEGPPWIYYDASVHKLKVYYYYCYLLFLFVEHCLPLLGHLADCLVYIYGWDWRYKSDIGSKRNLTDNDEGIQNLLTAESTHLSSQLAFKVIISQTYFI